MRYICRKCGKEHDERPSIGFLAPYHYGKLSDGDKSKIATLSDDLCTIQHDEQTDRFVRGVIHQTVIDDCETLDYGVWVSLSEKSFEDYVQYFDDPNHEASYFGYLCNYITGYDDTLSIRTDVILRGKIRPEIIPHDDQMENEFVRDYYNGIEKRAADEKVSDL